jgi:hypothetical protein
MTRNRRYFSLEPLKFSNPFTNHHKNMAKEVNTSAKKGEMNKYNIANIISIAIVR